MAAEKSAIERARQEKRTAALKANDDYLLAQTAKAIDAPQEVKDYVAQKSQIVLDVKP